MQPRCGSSFFAAGNSEEGVATHQIWRSPRWTTLEFLHSPDSSSFLSNFFSILSGDVLDRVKKEQQKILDEPNPSPGKGKGRCCDRQTRNYGKRHRQIDSPHLRGNLEVATSCRGATSCQQDKVETAQQSVTRSRTRQRMGWRGLYVAARRKAQRRNRRIVASSAL